MIRPIATTRSASGTPTGRLAVGHDDAALAGPAFRQRGGKVVGGWHVLIPEYLASERTETVRGTRQRLDEVIGRCFWTWI